MPIKIQSDGSPDKLKLRIVLGGDLQMKDIIGDIWSPIASMKTMTFFLVYSSQHKARGSPVLFHLRISTG